MKEVQSSSSDSDSQEEQIKSQQRECAEPKDNKSFSQFNILFMLIVSSLIVGIIIYVRNEIAVNTTQLRIEPEKINQSLSFPENISSISIRHDEGAQYPKIYLPYLKAFDVQQDLSYQQKDGQYRWYKIIDVKCQKEKIINSALKISENLFVHKTVYTNLNVIQQYVTIPLENAYALQSVRQFLANITNNTQNTIAFIHHDPLLLILATASSSKGLFVSHSSSWQLLEKNLILNNLLPLAQVMPLNSIIQSKGYNIIITSNITLLIQLLFKEKRQIFILIDFTQPVTIQTSILLRMKLYRFSKGSQCQTRIIEAYEESSWHRQQKSILMAGWYLFSQNYSNLPFQFQKKHYEKKLNKIVIRKCVLDNQFVRRQHQISGSYTIHNTPFSNLHIIQQQSTSKNQQYHKDVFMYLQQYPIKDNIFIESGPYYLMIVILSTLKSKVKVMTSSSFNEWRILQKNLVLNTIQISRTQQIQQKQTIQMIVTSNISKIIELRPQKAFFSMQQSNILPIQRYQIYNLVQQHDCGKVILNNITNFAEKGIYLLLKS